jgi:hypothetical protein
LAQQPAPVEIGKKIRCRTIDELTWGYFLTC